MGVLVVTTTPGTCYVEPRPPSSESAGCRDVGCRVVDRRTADEAMSNGGGRTAERRHAARGVDRRRRAEEDGGVLKRSGDRGQMAAWVRAWGRASWVTRAYGGGRARC